MTVNKKQYTAEIPQYTKRRNKSNLFSENLYDERPIYIILSFSRYFRRNEIKSRSQLTEM